MKKLVFAFIATVAMTFAACGGQTATETVATDSDSVAVVDSLDSIEVADTIVVDSIVAE
jgi:hypothetical protein